MSVIKIFVCGMIEKLSKEGSEILIGHRRKKSCDVKCVDESIAVITNSLLLVFNFNTEFTVQDCKWFFKAYTKSLP